MRILIASDSRNLREVTAARISDLGHEVFTAETRDHVRSEFSSQELDVVLLSLRIGDEPVYDTIDWIAQAHDDVTVVVIAEDRNLEACIRAMRHGAYDYIPVDQLRADIEGVLRRLTVHRKARGASRVDEGPTTPQDSRILLFESQDATMQETYRLANKVARTNSSVVLLGPSGTGKTVLARYIHRSSKRADDPFVMVHCPSLSTELLESELFGHVKGAFTGAHRDTEGHVARAEGGTLFLDEIGELSAILQAKLLRLLQDGEYERVGDPEPRKADVRVIAATNKNIREAVARGDFREDLYFRLNVFTLNLPPLRERSRDIDHLARRYLAHLSSMVTDAEKTFTDAALAAIRAYSWPGNLRELRNVVERAVILSESKIIEVEHLPSELQDGRERTDPPRSIVPGEEVTLDELEREHIQRVVQNKPTMKEAAETLGIDTSTLYRKRKQLDLEDQDEESP